MTCLQDLDVSASQMRVVSMMEIYIAFRLSRDGCGPLVGGEFGKYTAVTFAADFFLFGDGGFPFGDGKS